MAYATIAQFRAETGYTVAEMSNTEVTELLDAADREIKRRAYIKITKQQLSKETTTGKYFMGLTLGRNMLSLQGVSFLTYQSIHRPGYLADSTLSGTIVAGDIEVYEYDTTNFTYVDISAQIDTIDGEENYFTLNSGYPTNGRQVFCTFWYASKPLSYLLSEALLEDACKEYAVVKAMKRIRMQNMRAGVTGYTVGRKAIMTDYNTIYDEMSKRMQRFKQLIINIKPLRPRSAMMGRGRREPSFRGYTGRGWGANRG